MMTPAAAQLLATVESGERKPSFSPELSAVLVPAGNGFGVAVAVSVPGSLVHFERVARSISGCCEGLAAGSRRHRPAPGRSRQLSLHQVNPQAHTHFRTK